MKIILLVLMMLVGASCGLWERSKPSLVDKISEASKLAGVKHLKCETGDPIKEDVREKLDEWLKVKRASGEKSLAASSIGGTACSVLVKNVLPFLVVKVGDEYLLPDRWHEDKCSLENPTDPLLGLAEKFCEGL